MEEVKRKRKPRTASTEIANKEIVDVDNEVVAEAKSDVTDTTEAVSAMHRKARKPRTAQVEDAEVANARVADAEVVSTEVVTTKVSQPQSTEEKCVAQDDNTTANKEGEVCEQVCSDSAVKPIAAPYVKDGYTYTPHLYNIGDKVWIPYDDIVSYAKGIYDRIRVQQQYVPKQVTVRECVVTNHVSYRFNESTKLVISEKFVYNNKEDCLRECERLMHG